MCGAQQCEVKQKEVNYDKITCGMMELSIECLGRVPSHGSLMQLLTATWSFGQLVLCVSPGMLCNADRKVSTSTTWKLFTLHFQVRLENIRSPAQSMVIWVRLVRLPSKLQILRKSEDLDTQLILRSKHTWSKPIFHDSHDRCDETFYFCKLGNSYNVVENQWFCGKIWTIGKNTEILPKQHLFGFPRQKAESTGAFFYAETAIDQIWSNNANNFKTMQIMHHNAPAWCLFKSFCSAFSIAWVTPLQRATPAGSQRPGDCCDFIGSYWICFCVDWILKAARDAVTSGTRYESVYQFLSLCIWISS